MKATVRVMRSYDYCHFEVTLGGDDDLTLDEVNELRKQAALLVDESVRQYKIAKQKEDNRQRVEWQKVSALNNAQRIKAKPQSEWTIEEAALVRSLEDKVFWKDYEENDYIYADEPDRDYHFSMLRLFQGTRLKP